MDASTWIFCIAAISATHLALIAIVEVCFSVPEKSFQEKSFPAQTQPSESPKSTKPPEQTEHQLGVITIQNNTVKIQKYLPYPHSFFRNEAEADCYLDQYLNWLTRYQSQN